MKRYDIKDRETGTLIDFFWDYEDAMGMVETFENIDKEEGTYTKDFYEVVEFETIDYFNEEFEVTYEYGGMGNYELTLFYPKSDERHVKIVNDSRFIDDWYEDDNVTLRRDTQEIVRDYILSFYLPPSEDEL